MNSGGVPGSGDRSDAVSECISTSMPRPTEARRRGGYKLTTGTRPVPGFRLYPDSNDTSLSTGQIVSVILNTIAGGIRTAEWIRQKLYQAT